MVQQSRYRMFFGCVLLWNNFAFWFIHGPYPFSRHTTHLSSFLGCPLEKTKWCLPSKSGCSSENLFNTGSVDEVKLILSIPLSTYITSSSCSSSFSDTHRLFLSTMPKEMQDNFGSILWNTILFTLHIMLMLFE